MMKKRKTQQNQKYNLFKINFTHCSSEKSGAYIAHNAILTADS